MSNIIQGNYYNLNSQEFWNTYWLTINTNNSLYERYFKEDKFKEEYEVEFSFKNKKSEEELMKEEADKILKMFER